MLNFAYGQDLEADINFSIVHTNLKGTYAYLMTQLVKIGMARATLSVPYPGYASVYVHVCTCVSVCVCVCVYVCVCVCVCLVSV